MIPKKTIFYSDELNDDFATNNIKTKQISADFKYIHKNIFWRFCSFVIYFIIAKPLVLLFTKIVFHQKTINKRCLKEAKINGAFIYYNHTNSFFDAFIPNYLCFFKRNYIITSPDATSIPFIKNIVQMLGAIPVASDLVMMRKMYECIKKRSNEKALVTIYPEAHIWPFYTGIRPFSASSFRYPVKFDKPVYAVTNCYQKRKFGKFPKVITYVDGPFYKMDDLGVVDNMDYLRNCVYNVMVKRSSESSNYEYYQYFRKEDLNK
ncbi:MAG: 1-acyl-sn-glycerol-3-phosphate acyltransferase [Anaeroplasma sp.]